MLVSTFVLGALAQPTPSFVGFTINFRLSQFSFFSLHNILFENFDTIYLDASLSMQVSQLDAFSCDLISLEA